MAVGAAADAAGVAAGAASVAPRMLVLMASAPRAPAVMMIQSRGAAVTSIPGTILVRKLGLAGNTIAIESHPDRLGVSQLPAAVLPLRGVPARTNGATGMNVATGSARGGQRVRRRRAPPLRTGRMLGAGLILAPRQPLGQSTEVPSTMRGCRSVKDVVKEMRGARLSTATISLAAVGDGVAAVVAAVATLPTGNDSARNDSRPRGTGRAALTLVWPIVALKTCTMTTACRRAMADQPHREPMVCAVEMKAVPRVLLAVPRVLLAVPRVLLAVPRVLLAEAEKDGAKPAVRPKERPVAGGGGGAVTAVTMPAQGRPVQEPAQAPGPERALEPRLVPVLEARGRKAAGVGVRRGAVAAAAVAAAAAAAVGGVDGLNLNCVPLQASPGAVAMTSLRLPEGTTKTTRGLISSALRMPTGMTNHAVNNGVRMTTMTCSPKAASTR